MMKVLLDQNVWRDVARLPDRPIILRAHRWGTSIIFFWESALIGKEPRDEIHKSKVAFTKPVLDAWKDEKLEVVTTAVAYDEMSRNLWLNLMDMDLSPRILDPATRINTSLYEQNLVPKRMGVFDVYDAKAPIKKKLRNLYVSNYQDESWLKFKKTVNISDKDLVDLFLFWQSSIFGIEYLLTADTKFIAKSKRWAENLSCPPIVCQPKHFVKKYDFGDPDFSWTQSKRSMLHGRSLSAGCIVNARKKTWFLKAILKRDLGFSPPKDISHCPNGDQIAKALSNMFLKKLSWIFPKLEDGFYGPEEFDVN